MTITKPVILSKASAVFLDRDGVINEEVNYCHKINDFRFVDGVIETLLLLQEKFTFLIVITNQAGIARGYYSEEQFNELTEWMNSRLKKAGVNITHVYYCPHHPAGIYPYNIDCECRKPKPGMLISAINDYNIDPDTSLFIGDKRSDIEAAIAAGISTTWLMGTGHQVSPDDKELSDDFFSSMRDVQEYLTLKNIF
ncbi:MULTISPECIES: D-glycero-beta-D-manno-heptose 1,7-bisphosphate 7-phosphatase [Tatumella]|uniref:D,D-heptose 1,7-bisphosphate phosphatase n=1 Tax=Tatumella punctata TaxID=399969 RepID=A0ABW1VQD0_9GAMM